MALKDRDFSQTLTAIESHLNACGVQASGAARIVFDRARSEIDFRDGEVFIGNQPLASALHLRPELLNGLKSSGKIEMTTEEFIAAQRTGKRLDLENVKIVERTASSTALPDEFPDSGPIEMSFEDFQRHQRAGRKLPLERIRIVGGMPKPRFGR